MTTYLLFAYESYYPSGGMGDFVAKTEMPLDDAAIRWAWGMIHARQIKTRHVELNALTKDGHEVVMHGRNDEPAYEAADYEWAMGERTPRITTAAIYASPIVEPQS